MKNMYFFKGALLIVLAIGIASCKGGDKAQKQSAQQVEKVKVNVMQAFEQEVDQIQTFSATVYANITNNISPKMAVRIEKVYVEVGDHVSHGQRLAQMDPASLIQAKLQMDNDSLEFARTNQLYSVGGTSKSDWDAKKMKYNISKTSYKNLLVNTYLYSPVSGVVTARNYDKGDMFNMGQPLYVVEQIRPVKVKVNVSEELYTKIKKGMSVDVALDVYAGEVFNGKVTLIYPAIDPATRTFPVEITIPNNNERIKPGMFARVTFSYGKMKNVVVPDLAIVKQTGSGDRYVYVVNNNKVVFKKVELGRRIGTEYEIMSGLNSGDVVVVGGQSRIVNGSEVETTTVDESAIEKGDEEAQQSAK
jgi:RND family efflux transporter MFP subunit